MPVIEDLSWPQVRDWCHMRWLLDFLGLFSLKTSSFLRLAALSSRNWASMSNAWVTFRVPSSAWASSEPGNFLWV